MIGNKNSELIYSSMQEEVKNNNELNRCVNLSIELTQTCNFNCSMCYIKSNDVRQGLKTEEWISLLDEAIDEGVRYVLITGGEALIYPGFYSIVEHLHKKNIDVRLKTNGFYADSRFLDFLSRHPIYMCDISIYGYDKQSYYQNTGLDCYDIICRNINALIKSQLTKVRLMITNTEANVKNASKLFRFVKGFDCDVIVNETPLFPPRQHVNNIYEKYFVDRVDTIAFKKSYCDVFNVPYENQSVINSTNRHALSCSAGRSSCAVHWDGIVAPCLNYPVEFDNNYLQIGFAKAFTELNNIVGAYSRPEKCFNCSCIDVCNYCPAYSNSDGQPNDVFCSFWK